MTHHGTAQFGHRFEQHRRDNHSGEQSGETGRESPPADAVTAVPAQKPTQAKLAGNLPEALPILYGRDEDAAALDTMLQAHRQRRQWIDGVWFVELAPCNDSALVPSVIAQTLGIKLIGAESAEDEVVSALRDMTLFLVLDNCEHLLDACAAFVSAVLAHASNVKLLATSQEALHLPDEQQFRAKPLAIPEGATDAGARETGAVALFAARARSCDPRFELNANSLEAVIEICRRLNGIALAVELAAARVPLCGHAAPKNIVRSFFMRSRDPGAPKCRACTDLRRHLHESCTRS